MTDSEASHLLARLEAGSLYERQEESSKLHFKTAAVKAWPNITWEETQCLVILWVLDFRQSLVSIIFGPLKSAVIPPPFTKLLII